MGKHDCTCYLCLCGYLPPKSIQIVLTGLLKQQRQLYNVEPLQRPDHMNLIPHDYQLKGAAQADFCCKGPLKGFLIGDEMGLGKTLVAILAMWLCRDDPGMSLVVAPKVLCNQWVREIEQAWQQVWILTILCPLHVPNRGCRLASPGDLRVPPLSYSAHKHLTRAVFCRDMASALSTSKTLRSAQPHCMPKAATLSCAPMSFWRITIVVNLISLRG